MKSIEGIIDLRESQSSKHELLTPTEGEVDAIRKALALRKLRSHGDIVRDDALFEHAEIASHNDA